MRRILKITLWIFLTVIILLGIAFAAGYFYYGEWIRKYIITAVQQESKGIYRVEIGAISLDAVNGNFKVRNFRVSPDTALFRQIHSGDSVAPLLFDLRIDEFNIRDFKTLDAIFKKRVEMSLVRFQSPELTVFRMKKTATGEKKSEGNTIQAIPLPKGLKGILIGEFAIEKAKMNFVDCLGDSVKTTFFPVTDVFLRNIVVDSAHQGVTRLFNTDDIEVKLGGYAFTDKKGMNRISFGEISFSTGKKQVSIRDFHLEPLYDAYNYPRKMGYQCDRTEVKIPLLKIERIDMRSLLFGGKIFAGLVRIDSILIDDYRDMRVPEKKVDKPAMPQEALRKLKTELKIDTILVNNGKAIYYEQVGDKPGMVFFDRMNFKMTGLSNIQDSNNTRPATELKGNAYLMGKGRIDAFFRFFILDPKNTFTWSAVVGTMDLTEINAMLAYQIPGKIESGRLDRLSVPMVYANDDKAVGKLIFCYNNLKVKMVNKETSGWSKFKNTLVNFAANDLVLNNDNPTKSGKLSSGVICFNRNKNSSVFNYLWKSIFTGLKSTVGFNSKAQKEIIKSEKKKKGG